MDTGETGGSDKGGGVYDFHPLQLDRVEFSMVKVKGEANSWALDRGAKANACPPYADAMRCGAVQRWTHSLRPDCYMIHTVQGERDRLVKD